ncbi:MAG: flagellar protein FlgN [Syntrophales bacterium]|nr:flagellar protein FlgN [Syntrophales bacterium]MDY0043347.1 flagellar protein FlgN [Syntrophales bacterium]
MNLVKNTTCSAEQCGTSLGDLYASLAAVLQKETVLYHELAEIIIREQEVLMQYSAEKLSESNSRKETVIVKAKMLGEIRMKLAGRISRHIGIDENKCNLSILIAHADSRHQNILLHLQDILRNQFEQIQNMNESNRALLDSSILYVKQSIDFISRLVSPAAVYGISGDLHTGGPAGNILLRKG